MKQTVFEDHGKATAEQTPSGTSNVIRHPMQRKIDGSPRQLVQQNQLAQLQASPQSANGLPSQLRTGIEALSGMDMSDVAVHRNSTEPAQLNALAYAQGNQIHLGPGQEKHLPHEAWHVVQQKQGRVKPTLQMKGPVAINADARLESEADTMGAKAMVAGVGQLNAEKLSDRGIPGHAGSAIQRVIGLEYDDDTGEELAENRNLDADEMYSHLSEHCRIRRPEKLRKELARFDKVGAIFSDTAELIDLLASEGLVAAGDEDKFMASAKVGLELTFNSEKSAQYVKNNGFPIDKKREAIEWWKQELNAWTIGLQHEDYVSENGLEIEIDKSHQQKELGGGIGEMENWRVIYKNEENTIAWWWQMSMDPSVIEIQTAPASGEDFSAGFIGQIVRTIYKRAAGREFSPGGGGGHINVDFKTGFNEDPSLIPKVLVATEIVIAKLKDTESESYAQLVDAGNELEDPFIGTKRVKMSTNRSGGWDVSHLPDDKDEGDYSGTWRRDVLEKVKVKSMKNLEAFREAHALWLHTHPTLSQQKGATEQTGKLTEKADKEGLNATLHYQAVNIDHLFDKVIKDEESDKVEDPRRLEFRFFKGQRDLDDIIAGMELISRIVKEAGKL